jgi:hypothetical protein
MAFIEWLQANYGTLLEALLGLIGVGTAITGMVHSDKATGAKAILLKIAHILSAVAPIDAPGSLSVPLTTIDIKPKEPVA